MKVAILCNVRPAGPADDAFEEYDTPETVSHVATALDALGVRSTPVIADGRLPWRLEEGRFDFAFNMAEGTGRRCREAIPAAVCELLGLPFTGSDVLTLTLALDKAMARRVVSPDVPVARGVLVEEGQACPETLAGLCCPLFVKPNDEGSSKGIRADALAATVDDALEKCHRLRRDCGCPVLIEEFLPGPEVTVGVLGNGAEARVIGMMEVTAASESGPFIYSIDAKRDWRREVRYHLPPRLDAQAAGDVERLALRAYRLLGCRDVARLDFRLDARGRPHFIECNPLPGLDPANSDLVLLSRVLLPYEKLVQGILLNGMKRVGFAFP